jgi:predicted amidohydrolase
MDASRVAVALMRPSWCTTADVLEQVGLLAHRAAAEGVGLLVLPSGLGWWPVGYTLGLSEGAADPYPALARAASDAASPGEPWGDVGSRLLSGLVGTAAQRRLGLVAGGIPLPTEGGLGDACVVLSPQGALAGLQWQTHLSVAQSRLGLVAGDAIAPVDLGWCQVGCLPQDDLLFPEVARILCLQGAQVLVHPGTATADGRGALMGRLWRDVQGNQVYGLEAGYVGEGNDGAAVLGPCELTADGSGVLACVGGPEPAIAVADLPWERWRQVVADYPIHAYRNSALYQRYFPALYEDSRR